MRDVATFLRRDLLSSAGRQSALLAMLALVLTGLLVVSGVVAGGIAHYSEEARSGSSLNFIDISEDLSSGQHAPLTRRLWRRCVVSKVSIAPIRDSRLFWSFLRNTGLMRTPIPEGWRRRRLFQTVRLR